MNPEDEIKFCENLLLLLSSVCDLRINSVQTAAKKLDVPTEQINHLLNRNLRGVKISTLIHIAFAAGNVVTLAIKPDTRVEE